MSRNTRISVCLATYNGGKFIKEQLTSIIDQLGIDDEIIISDDHSIDNTLAIVKSFNDNRIKIHFNKYDRGYVNNFEHAIEQSSGQYLFLADQDDVWLPGKVDQFLVALQKFDIVVSDAKITDTNLAIVSSSHFELHQVKTGFFHNWIKTRYIGACMAFRAEMLDKILPFPSNKKLCAHDYWIALVGERFYSLGLITEPFLLYRRHELNASTGGSESGNSLFHKIKVRLYTLLHLINR